MRGGVDACLVGKAGVDHGNSDGAAQISHQVEETRNGTKLRLLEAAKGEADTRDDAEHDGKPAQELRTKKS